MLLQPVGVQLSLLPLQLRRHPLCANPQAAGSRQPLHSACSHSSNSQSSSSQGSVRTSVVAQAEPAGRDRLKAGGFSPTSPQAWDNMRRSLQESGVGLTKTITANCCNAATVCYPCTVGQFEQGSCRVLLVQITTRINTGSTVWGAHSAGLLCTRPTSSDLWQAHTVTQHCAPIAGPAGEDGVTSGIGLCSRAWQHSHCGCQVCILHSMAAVLAFAGAAWQHGWYACMEVLCTQCGKSTGGADMQCACHRWLSTSCPTDRGCQFCCSAEPWPLVAATLRIVHSPHGCVVPPLFAPAGLRQIMIRCVRTHHESARNTHKSTDDGRQPVCSSAVLPVAHHSLPHSMSQAAACGFKPWKLLLHRCS